LNAAPDLTVKATVKPILAMISIAAIAVIAVRAMVM
jgi:hypothetical protein